MNIKTNVCGENRAERLRSREDKEKKEKEESTHRWESVVRKLAKIFAVKLADMMLKDTFEKLVPHQSKATLDVNKFLITKGYKDFPMNEYFSAMISKTKYKAMLPELKELDINIWDLLPNKVDGFFEEFEAYIKQQGFIIKDVTNKTYSYIINWHMLSEEAENISEKEWNEFWKLVQICAYHHKLADIIYDRSDTDDDDDDERNETYAALMKKYNVSNWRDAFDIAKQFHIEKANEYTAKINEWKKKHDVPVDSYDLLEVMDEQSKFDNWLDDLDHNIGEDLNEKECYNIGKPDTLDLDRAIKG